MGYRLYPLLASAHATVCHTTHTARGEVTLRASKPYRYPTLYAWDVEPGHQAGVSSDQWKAIEDVGEALRDATPGALGKVRKVAVHPNGRVEYLLLGEVAEAHVDAAGALVWDES